MKNFICIFICLLLTSCKKESEFTLTVYTKKIIMNKDNSVINNIISYSIKNNTSFKYCLFIKPESNLIYKKKVIHLKNIFGFTIFKNDTAKISAKFINEINDECKNKYLQELDKMTSDMNYKIYGYNKKIIDESIIFIYPKQTLYFETLMKSEGTKIFNELINIDCKNKYDELFLIYSDSNNYKNILSREALKTIKTNNIKVYNGLIYSLNKVPITIN